MKIKMFLILTLALFSCQNHGHQGIEEIAALADGWRGEIVSKVEDESYAGWDVEIGDADNDGLNEILTTGCPHSRLYMFKQESKRWTTQLLAQNLAENFPGMGLAVKVADLNADGINEILLGTGQEMDEVAFFYTFQMDDDTLIKNISGKPECANSNYTHNLAPYDCDGDGISEVFSAYCGSGEITRYNFDADVTSIRTTKLHQLSGSGEEAVIADVDNDGEMEFITSNSYRDEKASVEIFEFDSRGELVVPARIVVSGFDNKKCFYASLIVGDVDNDNKNELIIGWKRKQNVNKATILAYAVDQSAMPIYTFAYEDESLDMAYFEKMMAIADADNDGMNELIVSTRGDNMSEDIMSRHFGHVVMFKVSDSRDITRTILVDMHKDIAESSWLAVGDADNDGKNEIILATGKGDRTKAGTSYVLLIEKME